MGNLALAYTLRRQFSALGEPPWNQSTLTYLELGQCFNFFAG